MKRIVMPILLGLLALPLYGKVYLVSVGIADYPGKENDLRVSAEDAKTISKIFLATKDASVQTLTNEDATQGAMLSAMYILFSEAGHDDIIMLYFSGHGTEGSLVCHDGLLSYQHIMRLLNGYQAKQKVVIVDACFAGKMRTSKRHAYDYNDKNVMFFLKSQRKVPIRTAYSPYIWNVDFVVEQTLIETAKLLLANYTTLFTTES